MKTFLSLTTLAALLCSLSAFAQTKRYAVVEFSANFMREAPEYEAELGDQSLMGTVVEIVGEDSYWRKIVSPEPYTAWVNDMGLVEMSEEEIRDYLASPKYICTAEYSHVFTSPDLKSQRISDLVEGNLLRVWNVADRIGSRKISRRIGSGSGKFLSVLLPSGKTGYVPASDLEQFDKWASTRNPSFDNIRSTAFRFLGVPYMWGGTSVKAVDCSGLVRTVWFLNGLLLPRNASQQARIGNEVDFHPDYSINEKSPEFQSEMLRRISYLKPGDLLFFGRRASEGVKERISHVAIYLGEGKYIHSSEVVRISSLLPNDPDYSRAFVRARRVLGLQDASKGIVSIAKSPYYFPER